MSNKVKGTLYSKSDTVVVSEKFQKREFVVKVPDGNYEQYVKMQLVQAKVEDIEDVKIGAEIEVSYNFSGKPFKGKNGEEMIFTTIQAWKIDVTGQGSGNNVTKAAAKGSIQDEDNDLPF